MKSLTDKQIKQGLNTCDKCGAIDDTSALVWIDSEDFTPKTGEVINQEKNNNYSALCEPCYLSILK